LKTSFKIYAGTNNSRAAYKSTEISVKCDTVHSIPNYCSTRARQYAKTTTFFTN